MADMTCRCGKPMKRVFAWDDAQVTDHAYNLYACQACGMVLKHDLWQDKGRRWLGLDGKVRTDDG